jgi:hypothetical protein
LYELEAREGQEVREAFMKLFRDAINEDSLTPCPIVTLKVDVDHDIKVSQKNNVTFPFR